MKKTVIDYRNEFAFIDLLGRRIRELESKIELLEEATRYDDMEDVEYRARHKGLIGEKSVYQEEKEKRFIAIPQDIRDTEFDQKISELFSTNREIKKESPPSEPVVFQKSQKSPILDLDLLNNAMHSLEFGMSCFHAMESKIDDAKFAIQHTIQSLELLFKEVIYRKDKDSIFEKNRNGNIKNFKSGRPKTITMGASAQIMRDKKIIEIAEYNLINIVTSWYNDIKHYRISIDMLKIDRNIGGILKIIFKILDILQIDVNEYLSPDILVEIKIKVIGYEAHLQQAEYKAVSNNPKEYETPRFCSNCENNTVDEEEYCHFCESYIEVNECIRCGDDTVELNASDECDYCSSRDEDD